MYRNEILYTIYNIYSIRKHYVHSIQLRDNIFNPSYHSSFDKPAADQQSSSPFPGHPTGHPTGHPFLPEKKITYFNPQLHAMMYINFRSTMAGETTNWSRSSSIQHTKFFFQAFGLYLLLRQHLWTVGSSTPYTFGYKNTCMPYKLYRGKVLHL